MRTAFQGLSTSEINQVRMYGCTEAQMREAVEQSLTFRFTGPAMMAASLMSDAQELINTEYGEDDYMGLLMRAEDARQTLNRAKWIDRKSTRLNSSHSQQSRMPSSA